MLIGPDAPLVFDDVRATFMDNAYDFYKPIPTTEYPIVDGHLSINVYLNALKQCFNTFKAKCQKSQNPWNPTYKDFDYMCFHTPFSKMVQKSFFSLLKNDTESSPSNYDEKILSELRALGSSDDIVKVQAVLMKQFSADWKHKCERSLLLAKQLGNIYTGSLYNGLMTLVCDESIDMLGKKIMLFSYGSGCASSMFMLHVRKDYRHI
jgi:hydroxymethylglutaryl-CoA synthase